MEESTINRVLAAAMGECCHEFESDSEIPSWRKGIPACKKCEEAQGPHVFTPDFFSEVGFFKVLLWAERQEWWHDFLVTLQIPSHPNAPVFSGMKGMLDYVIHRERFVTALYDFLSQRKA